MECPSYTTGGTLDSIVYCCDGETILMRAGKEEGRVSEVLHQCAELLSKSHSSSNVVLSFTVSVLTFLFLSGIATAALVHFRAQVVRLCVRIIEMIEDRLAQRPPVPVVPAPGRPVLNGPQHPNYQPPSESESETESNLAAAFPDESSVENYEPRQVQGVLRL